MDQSPKDIRKISTEDLLAIAKKDPEMVAGVLRNTISTLENQLERIDSSNSDITQRSALLLTVSGLLTFLPTLGNFGIEYLQCFLYTSFPFLILSLYFFYRSSVRAHALLSAIPIAPAGTSMEIVLLRDQGNALEQVWTAMKNNYDTEVLPNFRLLSASVYAYVFGFAIDLIYFSFIGFPQIWFSLLILCLQIYIFNYVVTGRRRRSAQITFEIPLEMLQQNSKL